MIKHREPDGFASRVLPVFVSLIIFAIVLLGCSSQPEEVRVQVDANADGRPISPLIYGISRSKGAEDYFENAGISVVRWGGNARSRFNWEINASNAGADWQFRNVKIGERTPGKAVLEFHKINTEAGAASLITIPMIGWVANDRDSDTRSIEAPNSASVNGYDPSENRTRTSLQSFARKVGDFQYPPDLEDDAVYQDEWVDYIVRELGDADSGGVQFYEMGNEPMLWSEAHTDVRPNPIGYDEYFDLFDDHANTVKDIDPTAQILAPSVWGWMAYFYSALDSTGGRKSGDKDFERHDGQHFLPWFLSEAREQELRTGSRSLDYLSVHYYPQGGVFSDDTNEKTQAKRLRSPRSLWDPDYKDESWIAKADNGPSVRLIPRLREWIDTYYPGTKLAITEWTWGAEEHISGGLAVADVLGIMGREGVDLATHWGKPDEGLPIYWAYRMFRNYDGEHGAFGDVSVRAISSHIDLVTSYASVDTKKNQIKVLLINKSPERDIPVVVDVKGAVLSGNVSLYQYDGDGEGIRELPDVTLNGGSLSYTLPPYSMTMLITAKQ